MEHQVIFVTSEATPLVKTGGLADVCGSLARELKSLGFQPRIVLPWYDSIDGEITDTTMIPLSGRELKITMGETQVGDVPVTLIGYPPFFHRDGLYDRYGSPYSDNDRRFILFSRASIRVAEQQFEPDLYHCHDWFTGAVPLLLNHDPDYPDRPSVFTIHNLKHQGIFPASSFRYTGLSRDLFRFDTAEFYGQLNLMKAGISGADRLTTVSPTYSEEIQTEEFGEGLEDALEYRSDKLTGILNGIDVEEWNPETDQYLQEDERYSRNDPAGKNLVKKRLVDRYFGDQNGEPLIGMVGRLVPQKGIDLIIDGWEQLRDRPGRWLILGTGDSTLENGLRQISEADPDKFHAIISFDEELAHRIEAGSDLFVMPSRYEPCGLNQMYSMQYGTVPVVHKTGGLADTVTDPDDSPGQATGYHFEEFGVEGLTRALGRAVNCYTDEPEAWKTLQENGMDTDWSWHTSASKYAELYEDVLT